MSPKAGTSVRPTIVVHGGVDTFMKGAQARMVTKAGAKGLARLLVGESALNAVEAAVKVMEDSGAFDAGSGSVLCSDGKIRMHASVMDGRDLSAGAVILIREVKNPVSVARMVMEKTDHVVLGGDGATTFARAMGFPKYTKVLRSRVEQFKKFRSQFEAGGATDYFLDLKYYEKAKELEKTSRDIRRRHRGGCCDGQGWERGWRHLYGGDAVPNARACRRHRGNRKWVVRPE